MIARVIIDIKHRDINQTFDYFVPEDKVNMIKRGMRITVPFTDNNLERMAIVVDLLEESTFATKDIIDILDLEPIVDDELFLMLDKLTENPTALLAKAFETIVPNDLIVSYQKKVTLVDEKNIPDELKSKFNKKKVWILKKDDQKYHTKLKQLSKDNIIKFETILKDKIAKKTIDYIEINDEHYLGTKRHMEVINIIRNHESITKRYLSLISSVSIVNLLIKKNVLKVVEKLETLEKNDYLNKKSKVEILDVNKLRIEKLNQIKNQNVNFLIHGENDVTQNLIDNLVLRTVELKKQVLILLPEVFLTSKYLDYYQKLFPSELVTVIDSLTPTKEKYLNKKAILDKESLITIGSRSAIFSKFNDLGLVVMLQSSDKSYIQTDGIYYDTFELALIKAKYNNCNLVLNTSVKTVKEQYLIDSNKLNIIDLSEENTKNALVDLVDMKQELLKGNTKIISSLLNLEIDKAIRNDKKTLLIMNQKGYAPFVMCRSCGYVPKDKETDIVLSYSEKEGLLRSNLTKYSEPFTKTCPICSKETMKPVGSGIEQLENYLLKIYESNSILRIDADVLSNKSLYELIDRLDEDNHIKIIIGTNMALKNILAKKVSVVGILMADQWSRLPKYDAKEQAYLTFMRAKHIAEDRLIIQTYEPENELFNAIKFSNDFYKTELKNRKLQLMPPIYNMMQIMIESESYLKAHQIAFNMKNNLLTEGHKVIGPSQSVLVKQNDKYRVLLLLKYKKINKETKDILAPSKSYKINTSPEIIWY